MFFKLVCNLIINVVINKGKIMVNYSIEKLNYIITQMIIGNTGTMQMPDGSVKSITELNNLINQMKACKKSNYVFLSN
jgi:hypothetical protein